MPQRDSRARGREGLERPAKRRRPSSLLPAKRAERPQGMQTMGPELYQQICQAVRELSPAVRSA